MWNLSLLRTKTWPHISTTLFILLIGLQAACWYPLLQQEYIERQHQVQLQRNIEKQQSKRYRQSEDLKTAPFLLRQSVKYRVVALENGQVSQWAISGTFLLSQWEALQEAIQEQVSLGLMEATWSIREKGQWHGELLFKVFPPLSQKTYQNWLPVRQQSLTTSIVGWELISVVTVDGVASALISYSTTKRWVSVGDWLPSLGMSVAQVLAESVVLVSLSGEEKKLYLYEPNDIRK